MDTIVALASPGGNSPRAVLRLSGGQALQLVLELFIPEPIPDPIPKIVGATLVANPPFLGRAVAQNSRAGTRPAPTTSREPTLRYSCLRGTVLVEEDVAAPCLLYVMRAPHSYTREDVVEIHTIGSPPLLEMLLEGLLSRARKSGRALRLAEPGEFTKRAFLNGRVDLSQAEAVLRIIRSRTDTELRLAARAALGGGGETSRLLNESQNRLAELLCLLELSLDFSDQDIEPIPQETLRSNLEALYKELSCHKREDGAIKPGGIRTVFYGPPSVGKSSLFNALLGRPRAITSPHPGTTRDTIEATLTLRGLSFCLVDTAGLREAQDVEALAVARSQKTVETSDLALLVLDGSETLNMLESFCPEDNQTTILVINKADLPQGFYPENLDRKPWQHLPVVYTSALTGEGLERLRQEMVEKVLNGEVDSTPSPLNSRQRSLLEETLEALERALGCMGQPAPQELVALELREALDKLGEVCGTITSEDILGRIFSQFCIGK